MRLLSWLSRLLHHCWRWLSDITWDWEMQRDARLIEAFYQSSAHAESEE